MHVCYQLKKQIKYVLRIAQMNSVIISFCMIESRSQHSSTHRKREREGGGQMKGETERERSRRDKRGYKLLHTLCGRDDRIRAMPRRWA